MSYIPVQGTNILPMPQGMAKKNPTKKQTKKPQKESNFIAKYKNGEGNGNPLQYSCLENPIDGGAW